jgi:voltage-gated potassium channel
MTRERIHHIVEKGAHGSKVNLIFDYVIMTLIVLNVISLMLETVAEIRTTYWHYLHLFDIISVVIFSIEYFLRIYISSITHPSSNKFKSALLFIFSPFGLIDLLAIIPFYLPVFIKSDYRFLRVLRLFKFARYNNSFNLIFSIVKEKKNELATSAILTFLLLFVASFIMFHLEGNAQPDKFPDIFACFWWAICTLTTVGYGDVYPITPLGKILSGFIAALGIILIALPTGIIGAGFIEKINKKKKDHKHCPHCGTEIE